MPRTFKMLGILGEGAFGAVHLAEVSDDEDFVQTLAVKWLHPQWAQNVELTRRLRDEARLLALLRHDHIVRVHGLTNIEGRMAILMEPVEGTDLSHLENMPARAALEVIADVADALDAASNVIPPGQSDPLNVVHRDIKPSNIMVTRRGHVKVMDFGVARASFDAREAETRSPQFGTARYMAPERWLDGTAEQASDIFSLGVTLMELVGGEPMEQPRLSREGFAVDLAVALERLNPWPDIQRYVAQMCLFDAGGRPNAAEVEETCRALADQLGGVGLRDWAAAHVTSNKPAPISGAAVGTVVVEDSEIPGVPETAPLTFMSADFPATEPDPPPVAVLSPAQTRRRLLPAALLAVGAVVTFAAYIAFQWTKPDILAPAPAPIPIEVASPDPPRPIPVPEPEPEPEPPEPVATAAPRPSPAPAVVPPNPQAVPAPQTAPGPVTTPKMVNVIFTIPDGVTVEIDNQRIRGPQQAIKMPSGTQQVRTFGAGRTGQCTFSVGETTTQVKVLADLTCTL